VACHSTRRRPAVTAIGRRPLIGGSGQLNSGLNAYGLSTALLKSRTSISFFDVRGVAEADVQFAPHLGHVEPVPPVVAKVDGEPADAGPPEDLVAVVLPPIPGLPAVVRDKRRRPVRWGRPAPRRRR
jgi:hypothetical protein